MEKLTRYSEIIQNLLLDYSQNKPAFGDIEVQTIFDTVRHHYQVVYIGWKNQTLIHTCPIHLDIKNDKIWLQWNGTERDFAEELVVLGVQKEDIVLGFQAPSMRKFTEYAVN